MGYDPERHHRKSNRLKGYDYSQSGMYYITIYTRDRENLLSKIEINGGVGLAPTLNGVNRPAIILTNGWNVFAISERQKSVFIRKSAIYTLQRLIMIKNRNRRRFSLRRCRIKCFGQLLEKKWWPACEHDGNLTAPFQMNYFNSIVIYSR